VALKTALKVGDTWVVNTSLAGNNYAITPTNQTPTIIEFAVPNVPVYADGQAVHYAIVLTKNSQTVTAPDSLAVSLVPTPLVLSSLDPPGVAAPSALSDNHQSRLKIHGTGFLDNDGVPTVVGGVFGNGTIESATNPKFTIANVTPNYVELWLPDQCDQEGLLMLLTLPVGGGSTGGSPYDVIVPASGTITAACMKDVPVSSSYSLAGETPLVNGGVTYGNMLKIPPGDQTITVRGPYLRFINGVWGNSLGAPPVKLNFHYTRTSTRPSTVETMTVDVPNAQPNSGFNLCLMFIDGLPGISNVCYGNSVVLVNPS
jgi:hypothetical protein